MPQRVDKPSHSVSVLRAGARECQIRSAPVLALPRAAKVFYHAEKKTKIQNKEHFSPLSIKKACDYHMPFFIDFFFERFLDLLMLLHLYDEWIDRGQIPLFLTPLNVFPVYLFPSCIPPQVIRVSPLVYFIQSR